MIVERLLASLGNAKNTEVYIKAFCGNVGQYVTLWHGFANFTNKQQLETYKDYIVDTFTVGVSESGTAELHINITGYYNND